MPLIPPLTARKKHRTVFPSTLAQKTWVQNWKGPAVLSRGSLMDCSSVRSLVCPSQVAGGSIAFLAVLWCGRLTDRSLSRALAVVGFVACSAAGSQARPLYQHKFWKSDRNCCIAWFGSRTRRGKMWRRPATREGGKESMALSGGASDYPIQSLHMQIIIYRIPGMLVLCVIQICFIIFIHIPGMYDIKRIG